jgi:hypothetical protein
MNEIHLTVKKYVNEAKEDLLKIINENKTVILVKGTTGNGGTTLVSQLSLNRYTRLMFEPLSKIRESKRNDTNYHCIFAKDRFTIDKYKCNITTCSKAYKYYTGEYNNYVENTENMYWVFDEVNSLFDIGVMNNLFLKLKNYMHRNNKMLLMTAYLSDYIKHYLTIKLDNPVFVYINVEDNGYQDINTYITNDPVVKNTSNIQDVCNIDDLILFTNQYRQFKYLLDSYQNTEFQLIAGENFCKHITDDVRPRIKFVADFSQVDPNMPLVFTSTIHMGGDIYFSNQPKNKSKTLIIDNKDVKTDKDICQAIGRIRNKEYIKNVYVIKRGGTFKPIEKLNYNEMNGYQEPITGEYSLLLNGKIATSVEFPNNDKYDIDHMSLLTALTNGNFRDYLYWEKNKKGEYKLSKKWYNYLKWLQGRREFNIINNECTDPEIEEKLKNILWIDYHPQIDFQNLLNDIEMLFPQLDLKNIKLTWKKNEISDKDSTHLVDNIDNDTSDKTIKYSKERIKLERYNRNILRCMMDILVIKLGGKAYRKYSDVRWYNSFTNLKKPLKIELLEKYNMFEYDIKTCHPLILMILLHHHKDLFNSDNFDFYNHFKGDKTRDDFKKAFSILVNGMYKYKDFNKTLKKFLETFKVNPLMYSYAKPLLNKPSMAFYIFCSFEDNLIKQLMHNIYETHPSINMDRLHDGIITTHPLCDKYKFTINGYNLILKGDHWYNSKSNEFVWTNMWIKEFNIYRTKNIAESEPVLDDESYNKFIMVEGMNNYIRGENGVLGKEFGVLGGGKRITHYGNEKGEIFSIIELSNIHHLDLSSPNFVRDLKKLNYVGVSDIR